MNEYEEFAISKGWKGARYFYTLNSIIYYLCIPSLQGGKLGHPSFIKKTEKGIEYISREEAHELLCAIPDEEDE